MRLLTMLCLGFLPMMLSPPLSADDRPDEERSTVKTAKERLVSKGADPQRLNDCKVPLEQRDPNRPRPDSCDQKEKAEKPGM